MKGNKSWLKAIKVLKIGEGSVKDAKNQRKVLKLGKILQVDVNNI